MRKIQTTLSNMVIGNPVQRLTLRLAIYGLNLLALFLPASTIASSQEEATAAELLSMSLEELMNVKITSAGKKQEQVAEIPASVVIVTRREIENYGFTTITEVLQHVSGLYNIDTYTGSTGNFGIRGFWTTSSNSQESNQNVMIMVNNVPQYGSKLVVPVTAVDRIEIIRGPMSVIYGSGAAFGAINIVTNEVREESLTNQVSVAYGSLETKELFARTTGTGQEGEFKYTMNTAIGYSAGLDVKYQELMSKDDIVYSNYIATALGGIPMPDNHSTDHRLEKDYKYLNFSGSFRNFYTDLTYKEDNYEEFFVLPSLGEGSYRKKTYTNLMLGYKKAWSERFEMDSKLMYFDHNSEAAYDFIKVPWYGKELFSYNNAEAEVNLLAKLNAKLTVLTGFQYKTRLDALVIDDNPGSHDPLITNHYAQLKDGDSAGRFAFLAQADYRWSSNLKLVAGVRAEKVFGYTMQHQASWGTPDETSLPVHYEAKDAILIPRLAAVYSFSDYHVFKLLYGEAANLPRQNLDFENTQTLEFNYIYTNSWLLTTLNLYRNSLKDLAINQQEYDAESGKWSSIYKNSGKMSAIGTEITVKAEPLDNLFVEAGLTYQKSTDDLNPDIKVAYSPDWLGQFGVSYKYKKVTMGLTGNYVDGMLPQYIPFNSATGEPAHRVGDAIDGYFLLDANLRLNFNKTWFFNIRGSNLFDKQFRYPNSLGNEHLSRGTIGGGRYLLGTLGWRF